MVGKRETGTRGRSLRRGDVVEIRPAVEILATLDEHGCLEGLPFMPEMLPHIGQRFTVEARVERACDTINKGGRIRRMRDTVILDDVRCDGSGHGGCDAGCRFYWKEAWLRRAGDSPTPEVDSDAADELQALVRASSERNEEGETIYRCQATEFVRATNELGWWDAKSFGREVSCGNVSLPRFVAVSAKIVYEEVRRRLGLWSYPVKSTGPREPSGTKLDLQAGDTVRVRSAEEISATLDASLKTRGLWFDREMLPYCGSTRRVVRRVNRFIDEGSGRMIELKTDGVILDGCLCKGYESEGRWLCPRAIYSWWRDDWLERAEAER